MSGSVERGGGGAGTEWRPSRQLTALVRHRVVRDVGATFAVRVVVLSLSMLVSVVSARTLQPEGRGVYGAALALATLLVQLGNMGLHTANAYTVASEPEHVGAIVGNSVALAVAIGIAASLAVWAAGLTFPALVSVSGTPLLAAAFSIPGMLLYLLLLNVVVGLEQFATLNRAELLLATTTSVIVIAAAATRLLSPAFAVGAAGVANATAALWLLTRLASHARPRIDPRLLGASLRYGLRPYVVCVAGFLVTRFDLLLLNSARGNEAAGHYSVALTVTGVLSTLPVVIGQVLFPRLTRTEDPDARWRLAVRASVLTVCVMAPVALALAVYGRVALAAVFGTRFDVAADALVWLLPGVVLLAAEVVLVQFLNSVGYPLTLVALWVAAAAANVALNLVLVPRFGIRGAGAASSLTYLLLCLAVAVLAARTARRGRRAPVFGGVATVEPAFAAEIS